MCSYVQEFFKNQYTSYLNKIEQYYKKNLTFTIFLKHVRCTVLIFYKHLHYLEEYYEELTLK